MTPLPVYERTLAVPVTIATAGAIRRAARLEGLTPGEWVRSAIGRELGVAGCCASFPSGPDHAAAIELERLVSVERESADLLAIACDAGGPWLADVTRERGLMADIDPAQPGEKAVRPVPRLPVHGPARDGEQPMTRYRAAVLVLVLVLLLVVLALVAVEARRERLRSKRRAAMRARARTSKPHGRQARPNRTVQGSRE